MKRLLATVFLSVWLFGFGSDFNCKLQIQQMDMQYMMYASELGEKGMRLYTKDKQAVLHKIKKSPQAMDQICNEFFIRWTAVFKKLEQQMLNF